MYEGPRVLFVCLDGLFHGGGGGVGVGKREDQDIEPLQHNLRLSYSLISGIKLTLREICSRCCLQVCSKTTGCQR